MKKLLALAVFVVFVLALLPPSAAFAQEDPCSEIGGVYDPQRDRCVFTVGLDIKLEVPLDISATYPIMADALNMAVTQETTTFLNYFNEYAFLYSTPPWTLYINYEVLEQTPAQPTEFTPHVVSVVFSVYNYSGGANGTAYYRTIVYDVTNGVELTLDDLFVRGYLPGLSTLVRQKLTAQLSGISDASFIESGTTPDAANFRNFALTDDELVLYFDEYQVAPGAAGPQELRIPFSELSGIFNPVYIPVQ